MQPGPRPAAALAPRATVVAGQRLRDVLRLGLKLSVVSLTRADVSFKVRLATKTAKSLRVPTALRTGSVSRTLGVRYVRVKLPAGTVKRLKRLRRATLTLVVSASSGSRSRSGSQRVVLR